MAQKRKVFLLLMLLLVFSWLVPTFVLIGNVIARDGQSTSIATESLSAKQQGIADFRILLVDDDDGESWETYFTSIFIALGLNYDTTASRPNATTMNQYPIVVWSSGDVGGMGDPAEHAQDEGNLTVFLNNGGRLFLSSQDWILNMGISSFVRNYLGVVDANEDVFSGNPGDIMVGTSGDPIGGAFSPFNISYPPLFTQTGDYLQTASFAYTIFYNNTIPGPINVTAVRNQNSTYDFKTVYFGAPFEAFNLDRTALMSKILYWLISDKIPQEPPIPGFEFVFLMIGLLAIGLPYFSKKLSQRKYN